MAQEELKQLYADLFDQYGSDVSGILHGIFDNHFIADDATQEAFLRQMVGPGTDILDAASPLAVLVRTGRNAAIDELRRDHKHMDIQLNVAPIDDWDLKAPIDVAATVDDSLFVGAVVEALGSLNPSVAAVLGLRLLGEMHYEEIAQHLDIPIGTVKSRISRGTQSLTELLKDWLPE